MSKIMLSPLFHNGMVLQRDAAIIIWGKAKNEFELKLIFRGVQYQATINYNGDFFFEINDLVAGGPDEMILLGSHCNVSIQDVLVGDVFLLGGQSNMELPIRRVLNKCKKEVYDKDYPYIRHFKLPQRYRFSTEPQEIENGNWCPAVGEQKLDFSATGYFFSKEIFDQYEVPIGLIETATGGTPIEAWMKERTIQQLTTCDDRLKQLKTKGYIEDVIKKDTENVNHWYSNIKRQDLGLLNPSKEWYLANIDRSDWTCYDFPGDFQEVAQFKTMSGVVWFHKEFIVPDRLVDKESTLYLGTMVDADEVFLNGTFIGTTAYQYPPREYKLPKGVIKSGKNDLVIRLIINYGAGNFVKGKPYELRSNTENGIIPLSGIWQYKVGCVVPMLSPSTFFQYEPSGLFNGMIAKLRRCTIKAVLWYQGESNSDNPNYYHKKFKCMVNDWRESFQNPTLPFLYVQLANFGKPTSDIEECGFAKVRDEQRKSSTIPFTAMASAIDLGEYNDLHPEDKKTLGYRLALCARAIVYNEKIEYCGPLIDRVERHKNILCLKFLHEGSGLRIKNQDILLTEGEVFQIFAATETLVYKNVPASLINNTIEITLKNKINNIRFVRYAWSSNPKYANLYNAEGLPASPFEIAIE